MKKYEMKPCKKCGGKGMVFTVFSQNADPMYYYCHCNQCGYETAASTNKERAKRNWNRGKGIDD